MLLRRKQSVIPLFDPALHHSFVPTEFRSAGARSGGPGRPSGRRISALPWTAASTLARSRPVGKMVCAVTMVGIAIGMETVAPVVAQTVSASPSVASVIADPFAPFLAEAAQRFSMPVVWLRSVMQAESAGDARAISPKGAIGLMQIMPETYKRLRQTYGLGTDPFLPRDNIMAGAAYLREMYDRYGSNGFLAAYNAGPGRYEDHLATGRPLPEETRRYLARLDPMVTGVQTAHVAMAVDPGVWTRAPLFATRATDHATGGSDSLSQATDQLTTAPSGDRPIADVTALSPRSNGLFVHIAPQSRPR